MTFVHGKETFVSVDGNDLSAYTATSEFSPSTDSHDMTTYGNDGHVYEGGLTDGTFTMAGKYDSTASTGPRAVLLPLKGTGAKVVVIRQPEGTGSALPQDEFDGLLTKYVETNPVADYVMWAAEFQISGDVDSAAQSA
jgi:hypothetical protein